MDPSIALGFYCSDREDFELLLDSFQYWKQKNPESPELFTVADVVPDYSANVSSVLNDMMMSSVSIGTLGDERDMSDDEYVML